MERVKDPDFTPGFLLEREQSGLGVLHKVFDVFASFLDDDVTLGFQPLFLGQNAAVMGSVKSAPFAWAKTSRRTPTVTTWPNGTCFISMSYVLGGAKNIRLPPYFRMLSGSVMTTVFGMSFGSSSIALKSFLDSFAMVSPLFLQLSQNKNDMQ